MAEGFVLDREDAYLWDDLIKANLGYRPELSGEHFGRMFSRSRRPGRLRRVPAAEP